MVSFQPPLSQLNQRKTISESLMSNSNKRRWDEITDQAVEEEEEILPYKPWKNPKGAATTTINTAISDIELHLETPLPSEWQRCLDIQSGEIYFYNIRTHKRTLRDPRESPEPSSPRDYHISLDLELNLPCGSLNSNSPSISETKNTAMMKKKSSNSPPPTSADLFMSLCSTARKKSSSDDIRAADQAAEMVATACMRCHMLVMLCKSSPTCPNCKFMHPPDQSPPDLFKPRLSLSC